MGFPFDGWMFFNEYTIQLMFIDSPDFSRRKVLNPRNAVGPSSRPEQYQFGLQRSLLAKHVAERLNSHKQDDQTLERFRKEAQELKRQKWLNKRQARPPSPQPLPQPKSQSHVLIKIDEELEYPQIKPTDSVVFMNNPENQNEQRKERKRNRDKQTSKLQRLLYSKEKQLRRKDKKLQRSRQLIEKMQVKIKDLERQRQMRRGEQELQGQKINALIEEMNYRIASNRILFQQELAKLKAYQIGSERTLSLGMHKGHQQDKAVSFPTQSMKKVLPQSGSDRFLRAPPSMFYELPNNAVANPNLSLLSRHSRNKLERINPEELTKQSL